MLRKLYRSALDHELGVVGEEISKLVEKLNDYDIKLEALVKRFDRIQNRAVMQNARAQRRPEQSPEQYNAQLARDVDAFDVERPETWGKPFG